MENQLFHKVRGMGSRKPIPWVLVDADISVQIIGINLTQHYNLLNSTRSRKLVNGNINLSVCVTFSGFRLFAVTFKHIMDSQTDF